MKKLGEQWIEKRADGNHMYKAVKGRDCEGCAFGFCISAENEFGCSVFACRVIGSDNLVVKDLGILNEQGLLHCPFCREYPFINVVKPHTHFICDMPDSYGSIFVECAKCSCAMAYDGTDLQEAIDAWNRRV